MDEETKKLLVENNEMLKKLVVYQKWNQIIKIVSWTFVIFTSVGALYFIEQNLGSLLGVYTGGTGISNFSDMNKTLKSSADLMKGF